MGLDERPGHQLGGVGLGHARRPPEAWKHSHNYVHHTYTNIRGKDKDLGYEIMRIDPHQKWHPVYLAQPFYNLVLMALFEWGVAFHDLDFDAIRAGEKSKEEVGARSSRASAARRAPRSSRTTSRARAQRAADGDPRRALRAAEERQERAAEKAKRRARRRRGAARRTLLRRGSAFDRRR